MVRVRIVDVSENRYVALRCVHTLAIFNTTVHWAGNGTVDGGVSYKRIDLALQAPAPLSKFAANC